MSVERVRSQKRAEAGGFTRDVGVDKQMEGEDVEVSLGDICRG